MDGVVVITDNWWAIFGVVMFFIYTVILVITLCENDELRGRIKRGRVREEELLDRLEHRKSFKEIRRD